MKTNDTKMQRIPVSLDLLATEISVKNECKKIDAFELIKKSFNQKR